VKKLYHINADGLKLKKPIIDSREKKPLSLSLKLAFFATFPAIETIIIVTIITWHGTVLCLRG